MEGLRRLIATSAPVRRLQAVDSAEGVGAVEEVESSTRRKRHRGRLTSVTKRLPAIGASTVRTEDVDSACQGKKRGSGTRGHDWSV